MCPGGYYCDGTTGEVKCKPKVGLVPENSSYLDRLYGLSGDGKDMRVRIAKRNDKSNVTRAVKLPGIECNVTDEDANRCLYEDGLDRTYYTCKNNKIEYAYCLTNQRCYYRGGKATCQDIMFSDKISPNSFLGIVDGGGPQSQVGQNAIVTTKTVEVRDVRDTTASQNTSLGKAQDTNQSITSVSKNTKDISNGENSVIKVSSDVCSGEKRYSCIEADGRAQFYVQCVDSKAIVYSCGEDNACYQRGKDISCAKKGDRETDLQQQVNGSADEKSVLSQKKSDRDQALPESCTNEGKFKCEQAGVTGGYTQCVNKVVVRFTCGDNTVCFDSENGAVYCGFQVNKLNNRALRIGEALAGGRNMAFPQEGNLEKRVNYANGYAVNVATAKQPSQITSTIVVVGNTSAAQSLELPESVFVQTQLPMYQQSMPFSGAIQTPIFTTFPAGLGPTQVINQENTQGASLDPLLQPISVQPIPVEPITVQPAVQPITVQPVIQVVNQNTVQNIQQQNGPLPVIPILLTQTITPITDNANDFACYSAGSQFWNVSCDSSNTGTNRSSIAATGELCGNEITDEIPTETSTTTQTVVETTTLTSVSVSISSVKFTSTVTSYTATNTMTNTVMTTQMTTTCTKNSTELSAILIATVTDQ
ncbi:hypothetical protein AX774_g255 [Zancudomyces culisetae]|uniref:Uncharacterized protein n=1 Tax=Zancudomyces culisetae TaxID=1213189 RepID=A0A1R1PYZ3_ZANCU|nr:hypothetical protein AX774_g255 [Zancudomyces culisetae]|eukprot:OMH86182.1 hypothetical protein AX774_g255 [Zancudomyces culisetae]